MIIMGRHVTAAAPPPGGIDTPTDIMGANALSWFNANTATMYQDAAKTTPATAATHPVYAVVDQGTGSDLVTDNTARRPILGLNSGKKFLDMDGAHLSKAISGTTTMYSIVAMEVNSSADTGLQPLVSLYTNSNSWWMGEYMLLEHDANIGWLNARYSTDDAVYISNTPNVNTRGVIVIEAIFNAGTNLEIAENGVTSTSPTGQTTPTAVSAPAFLDIGQAKDSGTYAGVAGADVNLYAIANCTSIPTGPQRADLRAWAADAGGVTL